MQRNNNNIWIYSYIQNNLVPLYRNNQKCKYMIKISTIIKEKGYTIEEVANKLGKSRVSIAQTIATGANPTIATLQKIADAIGCKVGDFFKDEITGNEPTPEEITINGKRYALIPKDD